MRNHVLTITLVFKDGIWYKMISMEPIGGARHPWQQRIYSAVILGEDAKFDHKRTANIKEKLTKAL